MPSQPHGTPKARHRPVVPEGAQQMAPLEATGLLPSVAGALARGSSLPTASVTTHPGCTVRVSVTPPFRKQKAPARNMEGPTQGWLEKVEAAVKDQDKTVPKTPLTPRQKRTALPQLPQQGVKNTGKPLQKLPHLPACLSQAKGALPPNDDVAPWSGASRSEASFHSLFTPVASILHDVPGSTPGSTAFCGFSPGLGGKAPAAEGGRRRRAKLLQGGRAKQKGRGKGAKLPPVPTISPLDFSRNFTFSFFELPPYDRRQHWAQCQQLLRFFVEQLQ